MLKKRFQLLRNHLSRNFPELDVGFYLSHKSNFVHMGLDVALFFFINDVDFIDEINKFLSKDLGWRFELVCPQLVLTVK